MRDNIHPTIEFFSFDEVTTPKNVVSHIELIFPSIPEEMTSEGFTIVKLKWNGNDAIGFRWNVAINERDDPRKMNGELKCKGFPNSRGYPTWYILPHELHNRNGEEWQAIERSLRTFT